MRRQRTARRADQLGLREVEIDDEQAPGRRAHLLDFGGAEGSARPPDREHALQRLALLITIAEQKDDDAWSPADQPILAQPIDEV